MGDLYACMRAEQLERERRARPFSSRGTRSSARTDWTLLTLAAAIAAVLA